MIFGTMQDRGYEEEEKVQRKKSFIKNRDETSGNNSDIISINQISVHGNNNHQTHDSKLKKNNSFKGKHGGLLIQDPNDEMKN